MTPPGRADLLALTTDALIALTNRGLVKRAAKTIEDGAGPSISEDGDAVRGESPDGVVTELPSGGLDAATCSCGATGVCRHVIALVLGYQALAAQCSETQTPDAEDGITSAAKFEDWSPGEFTDAELEQRFGSRVLAAARRRLADGYLARVHPATAGDPVPRVELPAGTIRFLVAHDLGYARSDARDDIGTDSVTLAVWAWRRYEELGGDASGTYFTVGGPDQGRSEVSQPSSSASASGSADVQGFASASSSGSASSTADISGRDSATRPLDRAADLAGEILLTGVVHLGAGFHQSVARVSRDLDAAGLRWPLLAIGRCLPRRRGPSPDPRHRGGRRSAAPPRAPRGPRLPRPRLRGGAPVRSAC